jgi:hypothetical protein
MGKTSYSEKELKEFIGDGWRFRVKKSKDRHYITRRKGQAEKSLGPYAEELWDMIIKLQTRKKNPRATVSASRLRQKEFEEHLKMERGARYMTTCLFTEDGFCTFYRYKNKPESFKIEDKIYTEGLSKIKELTVNGKTEHVWVHRANIPFCAECSAYISVEHVRSIHV